MLVVLISLYLLYNRHRKWYSRDINHGTPKHKHYSVLEAYSGSPAQKKPSTLKGNVQSTKPSVAIKEKAAKSENNGQRVCKNVKRPTNINFRLKYWQVLNIAGKELIAYSAIFDNRTANGPLPVIQVQVVGSFKGSVFCHLWYDNLEHPLVSKAIWTRNGQGHTIHGHFYGQYLHTCPLEHTHKVPTHISLVATPCGHSTILLPVELPVLDRVGLMKDLTVCIPVSFWKPKTPIWLVQFMETMKLLQVKQVYVYNSSIAQEYSQVFQHYVQEGFVNLRQVPSPAAGAENWDSVSLPSAISLNDCMYRSMWNSKYIILQDFDEVILPRDNETYLTMLSRIDQEYDLQYPPHTYTFRNSYFWSDYPPDKTKDENLAFLRYRYHAPPSPKMFKPKSIVDPRQCRSVFNHYCWILFPHTKGPWIFVDPKFATSHHYKKCFFGHEKCMADSVNVQMDNSILRYEKSLTSNVKKVLKLLKLS